jgi:2-acylglycerol O-acyltransferase 2
MVQQYFRGCILKEAELDPTKLYVFGFHPHGVLPVSLFWLNSCEEWRLLFPQVGFSILTASSLHLVPIMRDLLQWKGGREVSRNSCVHALRSRRNILVVPGGQTELMLCKAYDAVVKLTVRNQGFIKLAIQEGAHLVPVFSFGEHDVFDNVHLPLIQNWFLKKLGAALPFHPHNGRFLPIPRQERITVVVGKPIPVRQIAAPTADDVRDVLHAYLSELHRIFEAHKNAAYRQENRQLVFIDGHGERYVVPSEEKIEPDSE